MDTLLNDIRFGTRMLLKQPAFTLVAVITLALGIGANTAIFSVVNGVLLRPLPFKDADRLVMVWNHGAEAAGGDRTPLAVADLLDWRTQSKSFESIGAFQYAQLNLTGVDIPEQIPAANVTANVLTVLGRGVQLGRDFQASDEQSGAPRVVLLSDQFWRSHFGADTGIIGRTLNLNDQATTIIGVLPAQLNFPRSDVQLWRALQISPPERRGPYFLSGVARVKPGVSIAQARIDTRTMKTRFEGKNFTFNVISINDFILGDVRPALVALLVAVTLVLLIAAVNVANLTLVRSASRVKEISIRSALGASRARIIRRLLVESLLLALAGGLVATICAFWGVSLLVKFAPENLPRIDQIRVDSVVLAWTGLLSILTGLVFGIVPAWQNSRLNLNETLRDGGRSSTESAGKRRGRGILVVVELALAVMLVAGAGLVIKSLWRLQQVNLGINSEKVLSLQVAMRGRRYESVQQVGDFQTRLLEQTESLPGVRAAALSNSLPPDETDFSSDFKIEGQPAPSNGQPQIAYFAKVSSKYFQVLGIPLRSGRAFTETDSPKTTQVALINETFQRRFFPAEDALGKRLNIGSDTEPDWNEIVGVVGDVKYNGIADDVQPAIYLAAQQSPMWRMSLVVKTDVEDALGLASSLRNEIRKIDPDLPVTKVSTMDERLARAVSQPRFRTTLITLFAAVALILACIGIYGVISYSVSQRTHEIGIRMALGAQTRNVLGMIIRQAIVLAVIGVTLGLGASYGLTSLMRKLLFGVEPTDPAIFLSTALLLTLTALLASYLPARRAAKVDPLEALRRE